MDTQERGEYNTNIYTLDSKQAQHVPRINTFIDKDQNEAKRCFRSGVGVVTLQARLASTYPNLHCTYFPLSLSLCLYICGKGVSRKTKTDKQTAISSKPYDRPYNIRLYIGLYMYTNNLCATRAVLFRRHGVDVAPYLPRIAKPLTRSIAFPTCKLFSVGISCVTLYPFSLFGLQVSLGKLPVPCEASKPFLEMVSISFCHASHLERDSDAMMSAVLSNRFQEPEPEDGHVISSSRHFKYHWEHQEDTWFRLTVFVRRFGNCLETDSPVQNENNYRFCLRLQLDAGPLPKEGACFACRGG